MKKRRENEALTLCMAEDEKTAFQTASRGISVFLDGVEDLGDRFEGASVVDGVVGRAVALLCGDSKITAVYASTFGREAERLFHDCYGYVECDELVESIFDV